MALTLSRKMQLTFVLQKEPKKRNTREKRNSSVETLKLTHFGGCFVALSMSGAACCGRVCACSFMCVCVCENLITCEPK